MKRIVDGVSYNTETATRLARRRSRRAGQPEKLVETLYQTRSGAFFIVNRRTTIGWNQEEQEAETRTERNCVPIDAQRAQSWMLKSQVHVFRNRFGDPPEATDELGAGATIYIRLPHSLKRAVDTAASGLQVSGNTWAMRCFEQCLERSPMLDASDVAPLVRKLLKGGIDLAKQLKRAHEFWTSFFDKNSRLSAKALARELGRAQRSFEAIFGERQFAKAMMPLTCLASFYEEGRGFRHRALARKIIRAFEQSDTLSFEIRRSYLKLAIQICPLDDFRADIV